MSDLKFCQICLVNNVRIHRITSSEVQDVYERLTNKKFQQEVLNYACYTCHSQLQKCKQLVIKLQKSKQLLKQIWTNSKEPNLKSITFLDKLTYGLLPSLTITNIESFQTPEYNNIIKTGNQNESDTNEDTVKVEYYNHSVPPNKKPYLDEKYIFKQDEANFIEIVKLEYVSENPTNLVANENESSQIVCDYKIQQVLIMNDENSFKCHDCGKSCDTKALLVKHINGHKSRCNKLKKAYIKIQKSICGGKYTENNNFRDDIDTDENPLNCQYCNFTCIENSTLKKHIIKHTGVKPMKCQYCNHTFKHRGNLKRHIRTHTGEKPYKCNYCNYSCKVSSALKVHILTHTQEKHFKCQYCSFTCTVSGSLKRHTKTHTGEKPFKCQYCSYTCRVSASLKRHIVIHTSENPFKCDYCSDSFRTISKLNKHRSTHARKKTFNCQHCNYTCAHSGSLKRHIRTHTGEKPFKCQYCSYICAVSTSLKRHIRTHTGEKPFKCEYCSYKCAVSNSLKRHIKTHTGDNF